MMHMMMPIPPIHTTMPFNFVLFWWMIGLMVALFLLATILWVIGSRRIAQRKSQIKEAEWQKEAFPPFPYDEQPQVQHPEEEVSLRR
jgi:hypothetical protein